MTSAQLEAIESIEKELTTGSNFQAAELQVRAMLDEPDTKNDIALHVRCLRAMAKSQYQHGRASDSLPYALQALEISVQNKSHTLEAQSCLSLAIIYRIISDNARALEYGYRSLSLFEGLNDNFGIAKALATIGTALRMCSEHEAALRNYDKALQLFQDCGSMINVASVLSNSGSVHEQLTNYSKSLELFNDALLIYEELGFESGIANVCNRIGQIYFNYSNLSRALEYLDRAVKLQEKLSDFYSITSTLTTIANVHVNLANYTGAIEYYHKALSILEEHNNKNNIAVVTANLGSVYGLLSDPVRALENLETALGVFEEIGNRNSAARALCNIGSAHADLSNYSLALEYVHKSLQLFEELGSKSGAAECLRDIGIFYSNSNFEGYDLAKAEEYISRALALFDELEIMGGRSDCHKILAQICKAQSRWQECATHLETYHELKEHIGSIEAKNRAEKMDFERKEAEREKARQIAKAEAEAELRSTQLLLHRVLPQSIADRLMRGEKVADYFPQVSILFADIVGFTPIAAQMPARAVLALLNHVFAEFDRIVEQHGCEKIKTIGDGYMAIAGAPIECPDHAERIARVAQEMMNDIELPADIRKHLPPDAIFHLRIGLHTGSAFAGIIGEKRFVYDVYSDAVNLAARMQSTGEPGCIHCSAEFCHHLQNRDESFVFERRGEIEVKGKGMMRTYFLEGAR